MMRKVVVQLFIMTMLASCASMSVAVAMIGPDPKSLKVVTFDISERKFLLPLPSSRMTKDLDEVRQPMATRIDIEKLHSTPTKLLDDMWDWRSPLHLYGSLGITALVYAAPVGINPSCGSSLKQMLAEEFEAKRRESLRLGGKEEYLPDYSVHPSLLQLTDATALVYERSANYDFSKHAFGENGIEYYVIPVSDRAYLEIGFKLFGGGDPAIKPDDWLPRAEAVKRAILERMSFKGDWPALHDCGSVNSQN
jgi:hypothetical protein